MDRGVGEIDAVVFDLGGVLLDWSPRHLYRKLFDDEDSMNRFLAEVCTLDWHAAHDRGVPVEPSCAHLAASHWLYSQRPSRLSGTRKRSVPVRVHSVSKSSDSPRPVTKATAKGVGSISKSW